jgi:REP element-mobilizing transposase RayT
MPAYPRRAIVAEDQVGVYHCISRCVRRSFLCGVDPSSGHNYEHRKRWIRKRLRMLAAVFGIDVCGYAVMSNHLHVVLRIRPDLVQGWTDEEVALRWRTLYPPRDVANGRPREPEAHDLTVITSDPSRVAELRVRLVSLSWFMRCLSEPIARAANREDKCTGRFWEGRFKSQALLDEAAILACSVYVDLNLIRAGIADSPEESEFTSAFDRIRSLQTVLSDSTSADTPRNDEPGTLASLDRDSPGQRESSDAWLCELTLKEGPHARRDVLPATDEVATRVVGTSDAKTGPSTRLSRPRLGARASDQGYLPIELPKYLSLLDWTGRELRAGKRGTIPGQLAPILERLGLNGEAWVETVRHFGRWFKRAVGRGDALAEMALRVGRRWFQGKLAAQIAFR